MNNQQTVLRLAVTSVLLAVVGSPRFGTAGELAAAEMNALPDLKDMRLDGYVGNRLRSCIENLRPSIGKMSIMQPFSFVLIDEDHETLQDLVIIDSEETVMLDSTLLDGLEEDLDAFLKQLLEE